MPTETGTTPIRWDLTGEDAITQGADWTRYVALYYVDPADGVEKVWDITGYTARMTIRDNVDAGSRYNANTENGRINTTLQVINGQEWSLQITFTASSTSRTTNPTLNNLQLGVYDLEVIDPYGHVTRVYEGRVALSKEVSY
jgi:hypothetical protein